MVVRIGALLCNSFTSGFQEKEAVSLNNELPSIYYIIPSLHVLLVYKVHAMLHGEVNSLKLFWLCREIFCTL